MPKTILVADDEEDILKLIRARLAKRGYFVLSASNGQEAFEIMEKQKPDLVLVDYLMPIVNGNELIERMQSDKRLQDVPAIFMTASPSAIQTRLLGQHPEENLLIKPFEQSQLFEKVERLIGHP